MLARTASLRGSEPSAWSTADSTCSAVSLSRQALPLAMWRSQPSNWHGRHGSGFCTSQTLPRRCTAALAAHGSVIPPAGQGPQILGSVGPNIVTVGQPVVAARCVTDVSGPT